MNHSLDRLLNGMIETLRREVIPNTEGEFARGQAYGVIYMLNSILLRASWSPEFLNEQIDALDALAAALGEIDGLPEGAPRPKLNRKRSDGTAALEAMRNDGDAAVSALIGWLGANRDAAPRAVLDAADKAVKTYINRQLKHELRTSARPMFAEISLGKE
jgi:hypothetical protein